MSLASPEALKALDTDQDGTIDLPEAQAGGTKVFKAVDPDKDGTLDAKELDGRLDAEALKAADPDSDGTLDSKDIPTWSRRDLERPIPPRTARSMQMNSPRQMVPSYSSSFTSDAGSQLRSLRLGR
jgi:Ca2+-binding EF-hand superfamily protein